jgi:tetratricopeptide (TPR) repeat protein
LPDFAALHAWLDVGQAQHVLPQLDALRAAASAPEGTEAGLVLVRALRQLGAERESDALSLRLGRRHPRHAEAVLGQWRTVASNQGAYLYWRLSQRAVQPAWAAPAARAGWLSLRGLWLAGLRDDEAALGCQREALALQPADPWLWVEHSYTLARIDRHEPALEAAQQALRLCPGHRTGTLQTARVLQQLGRSTKPLRSWKPPWPVPRVPLTPGHCTAWRKTPSRTSARSRCWPAPKPRCRWPTHLGALCWPRGAPTPGSTWATWTPPAKRPRAWAAAVSTRSWPSAWPASPRQPWAAPRRNAR